MTTQLNDQTLLPDHLAPLDHWEQKLGDPFDPQGLFSFNQAVKLDDADAFPTDAINFMRQAGFYDHLVPQNHGGQLHSYQYLYHLIRGLSRRNVTTATVYILNSIGYWPFVIVGDQAQQQHYSAQILAGEGVSWAVTEREYGSDLINNQSVAVKVDGGYRLSGVKWPIGMCTRNRYAMFLAKTDDECNPDSFTMFCVDKQQHQAPEYQNLPPEAVYGVRGLDLSGVQLRDCPISDEQVIGEPGKGLEVMLRSQQLNRVGACALITGAFDTALRIALSFSDRRQLFGQKLAEIAVTRLQLTDAWCDLILSELTVHYATRSLHFYPQQMFLWGAVAKYLVPDVLDKAYVQMADVIGARYYLRQNFASGIFQKGWRDAGLAAFADGNKKVNLKNVALHMEVTLPYLRKNKPLPESQRQHFAKAFDLFHDVPDAQYTKLGVFSGRKDPIILWLRDSVDRLEGKLARLNTSAELNHDIIEQCRMIVADIEQLETQMDEHKQRLQGNYNYSPESYQMAEKYSALHSAAALIHTVLYTDFKAPMNGLQWVAPCLYRARRWYDQNLHFPQQLLIEQAFDVMNNQFEQQLAFTPIPLKLAESDNSFNNHQQMNTKGE